MLFRELTDNKCCFFKDASYSRHVNSYLFMSYSGSSPVVAIVGAESVLPSNLLGGSVPCCTVIKHCSVSFEFPSLPVREELNGSTRL